MDAAETRLARSNANPETSMLTALIYESTYSSDTHCSGHTVAIQLPNTAIRDKAIQSVVLFGANSTPGAVVHWRLFCQLGDQYRLHPSGSGCRYWCLTVLGDFERAGWVAAGTTQSAETWADGLAKTLGSAVIPVISPRGTFY